MQLFKTFLQFETIDVLCVGSDVFQVGRLLSDFHTHTAAAVGTLILPAVYVKMCVPTVGDKIKFPLCTDSPPTCERSCQQKSPKSRPKVASDFRHTLNVIKKVADLFLSGKKLSARVFSSDPSREHAQMEQEEAAIFLIRERYFIVYLHLMSLAVVCFGELD